MSAPDASVNRDAISRTKQQILDVDTLIGGYTTKADLRQTGMSVHFKFDNKVDIWTTQRFLTIVENAPGMLVNALRLLLGEEQVIDDDSAPVSVVEPQEGEQ